MIVKKQFKRFNKTKNNVKLEEIKAVHIISVCYRPEKSIANLVWET
tara:strand:+ start:748 stop:885 length:138 start_codon:yes stop_codon:yes gene_type:complete